MLGPVPVSERMELIRRSRRSEQRQGNLRRHENV
jgi:hypothetical protein